MKRLFASAPIMALAVLFALGTADAQQTAGDKTQPQAAAATQTNMQSGTGDLQQQGGWFCPWCGSGTGRYEGSGMGYSGYGMGPGMMGGGMMGGMMGGGYNRSPATNQPGAAANPGKAIFEANCSSCHPHGGNSIYPNLPAKGAPQLANFKSFLVFLRNPTMPDGARGPMPPFPDSVISDQQAHELYGYLVGSEQAGQFRPSGKPLGADQVKRLVENYIRNTHNPNLKLGKITKEPGKDYYLATITTKSGSLVDKLQVNEYTGWFRSAYGR